MPNLPRFLRCAQTGVSGNRYYSKKAEKGKDLYACLGVPRKATQSDIKQAYYNLTMKYHPDRNEDSPEAAVKFREVAEAYKVLGNTVTRERYDIGGMPFVESDIPRARKPPIKHDVKHRQFFEKRNTVQTKHRPTLGDTTDQFPWRDGVKKPQEYETPEERITNERLKSLVLVVFVVMICLSNHYKS